MEDHLTKVVHVDDMQMDALRENPSDGRGQGWDPDYWRSVDYFIAEGGYIGWTKDKLIEKQEEYYIPGVDAYEATWLTIDPNMSRAELLMRNRQLHHPDFNIEKTKRYLILLLMGLVQNEYFKPDSHEILSYIVNDMETIIESKGFVYFWELIDYTKEDEYGDKSAKIYIEADCIKYKFKWVKLSYHKEAMAKDEVKVQSPSYLVADWQFPHQNSTSMIVLDFVCKNKGITL